MFRESPARGGFSPRTMRISLFALLASLALPGAASAQPYPAYRVYPEPQYQQRVPPHVVAEIVRSMGLMPTSAPRPRGPVWIVEAVGQDGTPVRVSLDGMTGRVNDIVRVPGPRLVRAYPNGGYYDAPTAPGGYPVPPPGAYGPPQARHAQPDDFDDDEYPMKDGPGYGPQRNPNYYGGPRGSVQPAPTGPQVITRGGDITNSVPPRQASRGTGNDPLLGVPREFRGEPKKAEPKKTAAKPVEKNPATAPLPKPRPADAPSVAKTDAKPAETAPQAKPEAPKQEPLSKPAQHPVQGLE